MTGRPRCSDPFEAALFLAETLEQHKISYCIGGAHALGQYAIPRATLDIDINVFLPPEELGTLFSALREIGAEFDETKAAQDARELGMCIAKLDAFRVDIFTPSIDYSWLAEKTRKQLSVGQRSAWFLSAESLCVFKLLFFRSKDLADMERLISVMGDSLNVTEVRAAIVDMMGEDDPRTAAWDRLVRDFLKP
jgi:hypothetical protein